MLFPYHWKDSYSISLLTRSRYPRQKFVPPLPFLLRLLLLLLRLIFRRYVRSEACITSGDTDTFKASVPSYPTMPSIPVPSLPERRVVYWHQLHFYPSSAPSLRHQIHLFLIGASLGFPFFFFFFCISSQYMKLPVKLWSSTAQWRHHNNGWHLHVVLWVSIENTM
jgi:hypothetical protein